MIKDTRQPNYRKKGPGRKHRSGPGKAIVGTPQAVLDSAYRNRFRYMHAAARRRAQA